MQLNREKLAELLGCSLRTVDEYRRQGMPGEAPKRPGDQWRFDSSTVVQWLRERERQNALGEIAQIDEQEARKRKIAAEAGLAELEYAKAEGSAVEITAFESAWSQMIGAARAKLLGLGAALGPVLAIETDAAECQAIINSAMSEALQELSDFEGNLQIEPEGVVESPAGDAESIATVGAASEPDGKRVGGRGKAPQPGVKRKAR